MSVDELKSAWEDAERHAVELQDKKDEALRAVRDEHDSGLREAVDAAAAAQKAYLEAETIEALKDRPDGGALAVTFVNQGGLSREAAAEAFPDSFSG
jgi:hypothetical protein